MEKLYFAHPMSTYGTPGEARLDAALRSAGFDVLNPAHKQYQDPLPGIRAKFNDSATASVEIMKHFVALCRACDVCAVLPFPDGKFGAGVVGEMQSFFDDHKKVYEIIVADDGLRLQELEALPTARILDIAQTRAHLKTFSPRP